MRIRTIKPEFWESESLGKVSREARLLFIGLWSCCDDSGRTRAASRLLASRLYPYDALQEGEIVNWLTELQRVGAIRLYTVDGESYLDIPKWLSHQKIDRPSASRIPENPNDSASPRESSRNVALEQGTGNREQGVYTHTPREASSEQERPAEDPVDLPVELPPRFPKTEAAAVAAGMSVGVAAEVIAEEWNLAVSRGGKDRAGRVIESWPHYLRTCSTWRKGRQAEAAARPRNGSSSPVADRIAADRRLQELKAQAASHPGNPDSPVGSLERKRPGAPDHEAWKAMRAEISRIQSQIADTGGRAEKEVAA